MENDSELEKRAVEELLRETERGRLRAETMGPAGWMKCPLRGTNKRFLINTLRSTGLQQRAAQPAGAHSSTRGRQRSRSRTPPGDLRANGGRDHQHSERHKTERRDRERDRDRRHRQEDTSREQRRREDGHRRDKDRQRHQKGVCPKEGRSSRDKS